MQGLRTAANSLILTVVIFSTASLMLAQGAGSKGSAASDKKQHDSVSSSDGGSAGNPCPAKMPNQNFAVDFTGSVSNTGRTYEGPLCIEVFYNPIQQFVGLQSTTTTANGPDLSKVVLGGPTAQGVATQKKPPKPPTNLPEAVDQLEKSADSLMETLDQMRKNYVDVVQKEDAAVNNISL